MPFFRLVPALFLSLSLALAQTPAPSRSGNGPTSLTILHTNDLHAHLAPNEQGLGGFSYLSTALKKERENCERCLYLNAGDLVQGTPVSTIFKGLPVYEIANHLGLDASTLGNHEFDYGYLQVEKFVQEAKFPVISSNVVDEQGKLLTGKGFTIRKVGGIRVAIIGALLADLVGNFETADKVGPFHVAPVVDSVKKSVAEIGDRADVIVVLGHIHDDETDAILKEVPQVSVIVAGHDHKGYTAIHRAPDGRVAVENKGYGVELGRLDLQLDIPHHKVLSAEWKKIPIDSHTQTADPVIAKEIAEWESRVTKQVDVKIGDATTKLAADDLRRVIERAMREATGADLAYVNKGNVRDVIPEGTVLARAVWNVLPFDNTVVVAKVKGSDVPKVVRDRYPITDMDKIYTLATTDFTAANQASPDQLGTTGLEFKDTGKLQRDVVIDWIREQKTVGKVETAAGTR